MTFPAGAVVAAAAAGSSVTRDSRSATPRPCAVHTHSTSLHGNNLPWGFDTRTGRFGLDGRSRGGPDGTACFPMSRGMDLRWATGTMGMHTDCRYRYKHSV